MSALEYLLVLSSEGKSFKPLQDKFNQLEGFYNGIGYVFPLKNEHEVKQLIAPLKGKILKMPLGFGQNFESLRQSFKAAFFRDKLYEAEMKKTQLKDQLKLEELLDEINEEHVNSSDLSEYRKKELIEVIHECEKLKKALEWAEGLEKAISIDPKNGFSIKFIYEKEKNFLLEDAPEIPKLINFLDHDGYSKAFIRKGIVGMVVGAGGVGKTHFLTQLALSIVSGRPFLDKYSIEKPGSVFLGLGENSEEDIHRLLRKTFKKLFHINAQSSFEEKNELEQISKRLSVMSFTGMRSTFIEKDKSTTFFELFLNELKAKEPKEGWSCIILDPISRFLGADAETDNSSATQFISLMERITLELKGRPTLLFGHHMNKSGVSNTSTDQAAARGSSAITDGVRWQANLDKVSKPNTTTPEDDSKYEKNKVTLRVVKSNFTAIPPSQTLFKDDYGCFHLQEENKNKKNFKISF